MIGSTVSIIGAGPAGLFLGIALAHRGYRVLAVDRDPGPEPDGSWRRRGVMQFHHAHAFRTQAVEPVRTECPEAYDAWLAAGADVVRFVGSDGNPQTLLRMRRVLYETALRRAAENTPGLTILQGHVSRILEQHGRAEGIEVDGARIEAALVIDASGRSGRATQQLRRPIIVGGNCGIAYIDRQYQLHPGAEPGPMVNPIAWQGDYDGYQVLIFLHERGIFSVLITRPTDRRDLVDLRLVGGFEAACRAIPGIAVWTDPERARPITGILPGGELRNAYRSQLDENGRPWRQGLIFVGDSVATTTPIFGRGVATTIMQAAELLRLIDEGGDPDAITCSFDDWCEHQMRPWVEDHVSMDTATINRWAGKDIDFSHRLPSELIMAAAAKDPRIGAYLGPYLAMTGLPSTLDAAEPMARAVYQTGWRPPLSPGPSRAELADIVAAAVSVPS